MPTLYARRSSRWQQAQSHAINGATFTTRIHGGCPKLQRVGMFQVVILEHIHTREYRGTNKWARSVAVVTARRAEVARRPVVVRAVEHSRACANLRGSCFVWVSIFLLGCGSAESSSPKTANQRQLMDVMITGSATAYLRGGMFSILYPLVTDARKCTTTRTQHDRSGLSY